MNETLPMESHQDVELLLEEYARTTKKPFVLYLVVLVFALSKSVSHWEQTGLVYSAANDTYRVNRSATLAIVNVSEPLETANISGDIWGDSDGSNCDRILLYVTDLLP